MTHFVLVLPSRITKSEKKKILAKAAEQKLTVADTKKLSPPPQRTVNTNPADQVLKQHISAAASATERIVGAIENGSVDLSVDQRQRLKNLIFLIERCLKSTPLSLATVPKDERLEEAA